MNLEKIIYIKFRGRSQWENRGPREAGSDRGGGLFVIDFPDHDAVPPFFLGLVQGQVGQFDHFIRGFGFFIRAGQANADGDLDFFTIPFFTILFSFNFLEINESSL